MKETQTLKYGKAPIKNLLRTAGVAGGRDKKGTMAEQTTEYGAIARQTMVESLPRTAGVVRGVGRRKANGKGKWKGNTGANTRGSHAGTKKTPTDHRHGGGKVAETTNIRDGSRLFPRNAERVSLFFCSS